MKITKEKLIRWEACGEGIFDFEKMFPNGMELGNVRDVRKWLKVKDNKNWLIDLLCILCVPSTERNFIFSRDIYADEPGLSKYGKKLAQYIRDNKMKIKFYYDRDAESAKTFNELLEQLSEKELIQCAVEMDRMVKR